MFQSKNETFICQEKYANEVLRKFDIENSKGVENPLTQNEKLSKNDGAKKIECGAFRSLLYLTTTKSNIMYATSLLSKFIQEPSELHFKAAKKVLRYVKQTCKFDILYNRKMEVKLISYVDSDWDGSIDDLKSTSRYIFTLASGMIC